MFGILLFKIPTDATNPQTIDLNSQKTTFVLIVCICLDILIKNCVIIFSIFSKLLNKLENIIP